MNAKTTEAAGVAEALAVLNGITVDSERSGYDWHDLQRAAAILRDALANLQSRLLAADELREAAGRFKAASFAPEAEYCTTAEQLEFAEAFRGIDAALAAYDKAGTT